MSEGSKTLERKEEIARLAKRYEVNYVRINIIRQQIETLTAENDKCLEELLRTFSDTKFCGHCVKRGQINFLDSAPKCPKCDL
jgi:hypothetical protein